MNDDRPNDGEQTPEPISRAQRLGIPDHALTALEYQARRHYRRWRLAEAERLARQVIRWDLGRSVAWFILGDIEMRRMDWARAFEHFQQCVDRSQFDAMAWCRGGEALFRVGQFERARRWLEQAVSLAPAGGSAGARRAADFLRRHADEFAASSTGQGGANARSSEPVTQKMNAVVERAVRDDVPPNIIPIRPFRDE